MEASPGEPPNAVFQWNVPCGVEASPGEPPNAVFQRNVPCGVELMIWIPISNVTNGCQKVN